MIKKLLSKIVGLAIYVLAFVTIISIIVLAINKLFVIVTNEQFILIMSIIVNYAGIALIILTGLKCALKLPLLIGIPYMVLIAIVIVLSFFQPAFDALVQTFLPAN